MLHILAEKSPQRWSALEKAVTKESPTYARFQGALRWLLRQGYIEKSGERRTKTGFAAVLYQLTPRAYLATLLDTINLDDFIEKAPDASILNVIEAIISAREC